MLSALAVTVVGTVGAVLSIRTVAVLVLSRLPAASCDQNWSVVVPSVVIENGTE